MKTVTQKEQPSINLQVGHCLQSIHLIIQKKKRFDYYRGIYCIKKWCENVKDRAMEIINYNEEEMIPLTDEEIKCYKGQKVYHICKNSFVTMKIIKKRI